MNYGQVILVLIKVPLLSTVTRQHCPFGDFNIIPLAISVIFTSPPVTVSFEGGFDIPIATFTASTPVPPSTIELLAETFALYPIAEALFKLPTVTSAP